MTESDFVCDWCEKLVETLYYCIKCPYEICKDCRKKHRCTGARTTVPFPDLTPKTQNLKTDKNDLKHLYIVKYNDYRQKRIP